MHDNEFEVRSVTSPKRIQLPRHRDVVSTQLEVEHEEEQVLGPRQRLAWDSYVNPKSKTFGNGKKSALHAGYTEAYADKITTKAWWVGKVRRLRLLGKAEKVLEEMLEMPVLITEWQGKGDEAERVVVTETGLVKIKQDTAKFIAETQGKDVGYSKRSELTGAGGAPITVPDEKQREVNEALMKFLNGR